MKRFFVLILSLCIMPAVMACGGRSGETDVDDEPTEDGKKDNKVNISLWTYPVGDWGNPTTVASLIADFEKKYPDIHVSVEYLEYTDGDERIREAIDAGEAPDLVFEGPERLVADWGNKGLMADLSDLWSSDAAEEIYASVREACRHADGGYYEFPVCMTTHCMAVNYDMFREADALKYLDEETHTWTTEGFINAVNALSAYGQETSGALYCGGQGGDQGTRALVNNLYGGTFTDPGHTKYTVDSEENIRALQLLYDLEGICYDPDIVGSDEVEMFCRKELAMTFCWNVALEVSRTVTDPDLDFEILPMAFPTDSKEPRLEGGIWGFGVFDNKDTDRVEAAKTFIDYMTGEEAQYKRAVRVSSYLPVREIEGIYVNDELVEEYGVFAQYMGDYHQVTPGWTDARTAWWHMLQRIGAGMDVTAAVKEFTDTVDDRAD